MPLEKPTEGASKARMVSALGGVAKPLLLILLGLQFAVVVARSLFGETALWLQESVVYAHAATIMLAVGWTLSENRHVRIDGFRLLMSKGFRQQVERDGLIATAATSAVIVFLSWGFVAASWRMLEGSREVGGLPGIFVLKTMVPLLAILLGLAALQRLRRPG